MHLGEYHRVSELTLVEPAGGDERELKVQEGAETGAMAEIECE